MWKFFPLEGAPNLRVRIVFLIAGLGLMMQFQTLFARPDFDVHPRDIERRIDFPPWRDTLIVDNEEGNEDLEWGLTVNYLGEEDPWIVVEPDTGVIAPGRRMILIASIDGRDLADGHYYVNLDFISNDPTRREFEVPVAGHTDVYPIISLTWPQNWGEWWGIDLNLVFQRIEWGQVYRFNRNVDNPGFAELQVENLLSDNGYFTINPTQFNLGARGNRQVTFTFDADEVGVHSTTVTSLSNVWDPRELSFRIVATVSPVFRKGAAMPDISMDEDAGEMLVVDLDSVFICSDPGVQFNFPAVVGLQPRVARNHELFIAPRRNWNGASDVIITASVEDSMLADTFRVTVNPLPDPPAPFDLTSPSDGDTLRWDTRDSLLVWQSSTDPDGDAITYALWVQADGIDSARTWAGLSDTSVVWAQLLSDMIDPVSGGGFSWTVSASDGNYIRDAWSTFHHYVVPASVRRQECRRSPRYAGAQVYPNPFNSNVKVRVQLERPASLKVQVFDLQGRMQHGWAEFRASPGEHVFNWTTAVVPPASGSGVFLVKVQIDDKSEIHRMVLMR